MERITAEFKRKFTRATYKDLILPLAEMSFLRSFACDRRGDPYPLLSSSSDMRESVSDGIWRVEGEAERLLCGFFPYAGYELSALPSYGAVGFGFAFPEHKVLLLRSASELIFCLDGTEERFSLDQKHFGGSLIVSCRPGAFDVFCRLERGVEFVHTFVSPLLDGTAKESFFSESTVSVFVRDGAIDSARSYLDSGVGIADIRPIRYENGDVMVEGGKVYLTVSIRLIVGHYQGILEWIPGTSNFSLVGALFYDCGDGVWSDDVAASLLYHREKKEWYLWAVAFSHGHVLCHASFLGDVRFGVNVIDVETMPIANDEDDRAAFLGFEGDEDPDFYYDAKRGLWTMAICRLDKERRAYRYRFFTSKHPFEGYHYLGEGEAGAETGGSFVSLGGEKIFICGNDFLDEV